MTDDVEKLHMITELIEQFLLIHLMVPQDTRLCALPQKVSFLIPSTIGPAILQFFGQ